MRAVHASLHGALEMLLSEASSTVRTQPLCHSYTAVRPCQHLWYHSCLRLSRPLSAGASHGTRSKAMLIILSQTFALLSTCAVPTIVRLLSGLAVQQTSLRSGLEAVRAQVQRATLRGSCAARPVSPSVRAIARRWRVATVNHRNLLRLRLRLLPRLLLLPSFPSLPARWQPGRTPIIACPWGRRAPSASSALLLMRLHVQHELANHGACYSASCLSAHCVWVTDAAQCK